MAYLNFPLNPAIGDIHVVGARSWVWTGTAWALQPSPAAFSTLTVSTLIATSTANSTSTNTGAVQIVGGLGVGQDVYIGGSLTVEGTLFGLSDLTGGLPGELVYQIDTGDTGFVSTSTAGYVLISGGSASPQWQNFLNLSSTTPATSTDTGALTVVGGAGVGGDIYAGGNIYSQGALTITTATLKNSLASGTDITITDIGAGVLQIDNTSTLQSVTDRGATTNNIVYLTNTTESTSTLTGAMVITGGIGVGKRVTCESVRITDTIFDSTESRTDNLATVLVDSYSINEYRAAKYLIQIDDGSGPTAKFQMTEILMLASNTGTVKITEYGSIESDGLLGVFTADVMVGNIATLYFTPYQASNKIIYALRTAIQA